MFQSKQKSDDKVEREDGDASFHTSHSISLPYPAAQKTLSLKVRDMTLFVVVQCCIYNMFSRVVLNVEN